MKIGSIVRIDFDPNVKTWQAHFQQGVGILGNNFDQLHDGGWDGGKTTWEVLWPDGVAAWYDEDDMAVLREATDAMELGAYRMRGGSRADYPAAWQRFMELHGAGLER